MGILDDLKGISDFGSVMVHVVSDDDANADPRIPKNVLERLGPDDVLIGKLARAMYIRQSHWDRIKHLFPEKRELA